MSLSKGFQLFNLIALPHPSSNVVFWSVFLIFKPDFPSHIVKGNRIITVYRTNADVGGEYQQDPF